MNYREVNFKERKPKWSANNYFYKSHTSFGHVYSMKSGYVGHMEKELKEFPGHTLVWLEPENEYNENFKYTNE